MMSMNSDKNEMKYENMNVNGEVNIMKTMIIKQKIKE